MCGSVKKLEKSLAIFTLIITVFSLRYRVSPRLLFPFVPGHRFSEFLLTFLYRHPFINNVLIYPFNLAQQPARFNIGNERTVKTIIVKNLFPAYLCIYEICQSSLFFLFPTPSSHHLREQFHSLLT